MKNLFFAFSLLVLAGCVTTEYSNVGENVRKVTLKEKDKVASEFFEQKMADTRKWYQVIKVSDGWELTPESKIKYEFDKSGGGGC